MTSRPSPTVPTLDNAIFDVQVNPPVDVGGKLIFSEELIRSICAIEKSHWKIHVILLNEGIEHG